MLQLAVTAHVEVANEVVLADSSLLHGLIRPHSVPAGKDCKIAISRRSVSGMRQPLGNRIAGCTAHPKSATGQVCNGSKAAEIIRTMRWARSIRRTRRRWYDLADR